MLLRNIAAATAAVIALSIAGSASATVTQLQFSAPGAGQELYFNGFVEGTNVVDPTIHATFVLTLDSITDGGYAWNFSYQLVNTSTDPSRLTVIGWDLDPRAESLTNIAGALGTAGSGNLASLGSKDYCLKSGGGASNCSGGGGGGLLNGESGTGSFTYNFASETLIGYHTEQVLKGKKLVTVEAPDYGAVAAPTTLTFNNFGVHYQSLAAGNSTVGIPGEPSNGLQGGVPEPATWAMMILGFFGMGSAIRRRRAEMLSV